MSNPTVTADFLTTLYAEAIEARPSLRILVWSLPKSRSYFCGSVKDATAKATALDVAGEDVYVGVGLAPHDYGPKHRCAAAEIAGLVGLWADIDILDPVHQKTQLAESEEIALAIVNARLAPTITLHSGHGLQCWWLFNEPWLFDAPAEHAAASALIARWQKTVSADARAQHCQVDATQDLARILRVAGTTNYKVRADAREVRIIETALYRFGQRYSPEDFEPLLIEDGNAVGRTFALPGVNVGPLQIGHDAHIPDNMTTLMANDNKLRRTWNQQRKDTEKWKDTSQSAWDLSLANQLIEIGWSDQDIANALIAYRREHGADLKLRENYYQLTIAKAREGKVSSEADEELNDAIEELKSAAQTGTIKEVLTDDNRAGILATLSVRFGLNLVNIIKYVGTGNDTDQAQYVFVTADRTITIGGAEILTSQAKLRVKIAEMADMMLPIFKPARWTEIADLVLKVAEHQELHKEASARGQMESWLSSYLAGTNILDSIEDAESDRSPFWRHGRINIFGDSLRSWLTLAQREQITAKRMGVTLRGLGAEPDIVSLPLGETRTTRGVWILPAGLIAIEPHAVYVKEEVAARKNGHG